MRLVSPAAGHEATVFVCPLVVISGIVAILKLEPNNQPCIEKISTKVPAPVMPQLKSVGCVNLHPFLGVKVEKSSFEI